MIYSKMTAGDQGLVRAELLITQCKVWRAGSALRFHGWLRGGQDTAWVMLGYSQFHSVRTGLNVLLPSSLPRPVKYE